MPVPGDLLDDASVPADETLGAAIEMLRSTRAAGVAVVDAARRVVGLVDELSAVRGMFPPYLSELEHTAFIEDDEEALALRREQARAEPVTRHMRPATTVPADASLMHIAELFLHCDSTAIAVVSSGNSFVGILSLDDFARHVI